MNSPVQEIKERLDIVEFIRSYVSLIPAGKNFKALCPFHKEKTPSFMVSPERQTWHCFGSCNEGGDIFKFLMKHDNLEFYEALRILAEKAGVELKKTSPAEYRQFGILYDINNTAKDFFKKKLLQSKSAQDYLKKRGLKEETINEFEIGLAPDSFDDLTVDLSKAGYNVKDIERAGLNFKTERGSYVDRFRGRIMFPIYNSFGKVVGFSGRISPRLQKENPELAKYVNSPETSIFNKSKILYGFHVSKSDIRQSRTAVLMEGQMDFLMAYQDGVRNAVATSGTALTPEHIKLLKRVADELVMSFDSDEAGLRAAESAIDLASSADISVKLLILEEYKDPAEAVESSPGYLLEALKKTKPAMEFYFDRYLGESSDIKSQISKIGMSGFKNKLRLVLEKIKNLASAVERGHWIKELASKTQVGENSLLEELAQLKNEKLASRGGNPNSQQEKPEPLSRRDLIAQRLISLAAGQDEFISSIKDYVNFLPENYSIVFKKISKGELKTEEWDENLEELFNVVTLRSSFETSILGEEKIKEEFEELLRQLEKEYIREKKEELMSFIKEAEQKGEEKKVEAALKEFSEIVKMMKG